MDATPRHEYGQRCENVGLAVQEDHVPTRRGRESEGGEDSADQGVWDDSLTYSAAPSAKIAGTDSSGQSHDVEMTDAASEVTPPAQVAAPSEAKAPARQAKPKGPTPKTKPPPTRPVLPPKASPSKAKAKGPDIRSVPKAPVPTVPAKGGMPARSPDPGSTATKGAPPAQLPALPGGVRTLRRHIGAARR